jgi:DNA modification methylase
MARRKTTTVLKNDARNANQHTEASNAAVKRSLEAFGAGRSIVADRTGTLIGGEATHRAAQDLGIPIQEVRTDGTKLICVIREDLEPDDQRRRALALADNQTAKLADFGEDSLVRELQAVEDQGLLDAIGFTADELSDLLDPEDATAAVFPDLPPSDEPAISRLGDLWTLGDHRLLVGDSTKAEDVDRLMEGQKAALFFSDPPYGVSYKGVMNADGTPSKTGGWNDIASDNLRDDDLIQNLLLPAFRQAVRVSQDDAAFYIWHASTTRRDFEFALQAAGLQERQYIIWVKPTMVMGHSDYHYMHEPVFYCSKAGHKPKWTGDRTQTTVWRVTNVPTGGAVAICNGLRITDGQGAELFVQTRAPKARKLRLMRLRQGETLDLTTGGNGDVWEVELDPKSEVQHPTQKPAELACRAIRNHCDRGNVVYDAFGGSGSTMMGCIQTGMRARTMELSPAYCDVQIIRFQEKSGQQAVRHDGVTFNELNPDPEGASQ